MLIRALLALTLTLIAIPASAELTWSAKTYALVAVADKASTLNCTLRPGCGEATPGYAWLDRTGGPALQMAVSTSVDALSIWGWQKLVGKTHPKWATAGFLGMSVLRGFIAVRNVRRVHQSYAN